MADGSSTTGELSSFRKLLSKDVGGGKSAWKMTLESFGMIEGGKDMENDIVVDSTADVDDDSLEEVAIDALKKLEEMELDDYDEKADAPAATTTTATDLLLENFGANRNDLLRAFIRWSYKPVVRGEGEEEESSSKAGGGVFHVSKTYRRYKAYKEWMRNNFGTTSLLEDFLNNNTGKEKLKQLQESWKIHLTHDASNRLVVWACGFDGYMSEMKHVPHEDTLLYCVWLCHLIMLDDKAQNHGAIVMSAVGKNVGMLELFTLIPLEMQTTFDRLFMGTLPIRVHSFVLFNNPTWIRFLLALVKPFLSKKMKKRMVVVSSSTREDPIPEIIETIVGGKKYIPKAINPKCNLEGTLEMDLIDEKLAAK